MIEAEKGTRENTRAVFNEMMKRGWNTKWQFVLVSEKPEELLPMKHSRTTVIKRADYQDNGLIKKRYRWYRLRAAMIIDENRQIPKSVDQTIRVFYPMEAR